MIGRIVSVAIIAAALVLHAPSPAAAQGQDWPAERARLVAAAEKEGALVVFALPNQVMRDFVQREWSQAFPKIELSSSVMTHPQFIARVRVERGAGKYLWDVGLNGPTSAFVLAPEGAIDPLLPELVDPDVGRPELWGGWDRAFIDSAGRHVFAFSAYLTGPYFDALRIPPEKVERLGLRLMLEPEYRGKTVWNDPLVPGAGQSTVHLLRKVLGDDGLRRLVVDQQVAFVPRQHEVVEAMARGTAWIGIGPPIKMLMEPYLKAGVKADVRSFGTSADRATLTQGGTTLYLFERRPHPAAARLFVNWILSRDVQARIAAVREQNSARRDVAAVTDPDVTPVPGVTYDATQREEFEPQIAAGVELIRQLRRP